MVAPKEEKSGWFGSVWNSIKAKAVGYIEDEYNLLDDPGTVKEGAKDWLNAEVMMTLAFNI